MTTLALFSTALLFGGMLRYTFGFAAFLFKALPPDVAGSVIRRAFPHFYLFVASVSAIAGALIWSSDPHAGAILAAITLSTVPTRQILMPAINAATDARNRRRFKGLHGLSVIITLIHIGLAGYVLTRFLSMAPA